jgi:hypothetical protein
VRTGVFGVPRFSAPANGLYRAVTVAHLTAFMFSPADKKWENLTVASDRQIQANRRNARRSTGPKTPNGKMRIASNAVVHGMRSIRLWALKSEEQNLLKMAEEMWTCHQPIGAQEEALLKLMIYDLLTIDRVQFVETFAMSRLLQDHQTHPPPRRRTLRDIAMRAEELTTEKKLARLDPLDQARVRECIQQNLRSEEELLDSLTVEEPDPLDDYPPRQQQPPQADGNATGESQREIDQHHRQTDREQPSGLFEIATPTDAKDIGLEGLGETFAANLEVFNLLSRYKTNRENAYLKKLHELQRLQAARRGQSVESPISVDVNINSNGSNSH